MEQSLAATASSKKPLFYRIQSPSYNGQLDFWKFVFGVVIVLFHGTAIGGYERRFMQSGATAVEFFFIVSGYFMAVAVMRKSEPAEALGQETMQFIWHKVKGILPYYLLAYVLALGSYLWFFLQTSPNLETIILRLGGGLTNFFLLSTSGIKETPILGLTWYISAMLLAMAILYPLFRKFKNMYLYVLAPLSAILLTGYLCQKYGSFSLSYELDAVVLKEILRAIVGLNIGCCVYLASQKLCSLTLKTSARVLLGLLELGLYGWIILCFSLMKSNYVFTQLFLLFFAVTITASKQSIFSRLFDNNLCKWLGQLSLVLYLCHSPCRRILIRTGFDIGFFPNILTLLVISLAVSLLCMGILSGIRRVRAHRQKNAAT